MCDPFINVSVILDSKYRASELNNITHISQNHQAIKIAAFYSDPFVSDCFTDYPDKCKRPGLEIEYIYTVIRTIAGFNVTLIHMPTYSSLEEALDRKEVDVIGTTMPLTPEFVQRWKFTPVTFFDGAGFVVKKYVEEAFRPNFYLFRTFKLDFWMALATFTSVIVLLRHLWMKHASKNVKRPRTFYFMLTKTFGSKVLFGLWFIVLSVLLNFFSNFIIVQLVLSHDTPKRLFNSIEELGQLVVRNKCRLVIVEKYFDDPVFVPSILNPTHNKSWAADFRLAFETNSPIMAKDRAHLAKIVNSGTCNVGLDYITLSDYYSKRFCDVEVLTFDDGFIASKFVYYHQFDEIISDVLNSIITSNPLVSYSEYLTKTYYYAVSSSCFTREKGDAEKIDLEKIKDCFYILALGFIIAGIIHSRAWLYKPRFKSWNVPTMHYQCTNQK